MIAWPVVMSLSSNCLFISDSKHRRIYMLAAFQICSSARSSEHCTKGDCLVLWSLKYFLDLVQKMHRASYAHGVLSLRYWMFFMAFNVFFKVKMLRHLWWYWTDVILFLPMSLTTFRTGMTLDFCDFRQRFPRVHVLQCHLPLNSGKCNPRKLVALVGCINLLN